MTKLTIKEIIITSLIHILFFAGLFFLLFVLSQYKSHEDGIKLEEIKQEFKEYKEKENNENNRFTQSIPNS